MADLAIAASGLRKFYRDKTGDKVVLDGIDLTVGGRMGRRRGAAGAVRVLAHLAGGRARLDGQESRGREQRAPAADAPALLRLRMHQAAAGQEPAEHRIPDLPAGTGVAFVRGAATAIDADAREVTVDGAGVLGYDTLVYALGSSTDTGRVPGADAHAFTLNGPEAAGRLAGRLAAIAGAGGAVAVCGGGLTGVEAATEIAENHPGLSVTLISLQEPGGMMGAKARAHLYRALDRLGGTVVAGARVARVLPDAVELEGGRLVPCDACLWTAGVKVPPLAGEAVIATDERGLIVVDAMLRSVSSGPMILPGAGF